MTTTTHDFNIADSSSGITGFTNRRNVMGITSNAARAITGNNDCVATCDTPAGSDDFTVTITVKAKVGDFNPPVRGYGGCDTDGTGAFVEYTTSTGDFAIKTTSATWDPGAATARVVVGGQTLADTDQLTLERVGNSYQMKKNGTNVGSAWVDSGDAVPRDADHRLYGPGGQEFIGAYWPIDTLVMIDTAGEEPGGGSVQGSAAAMF